MKVTLDLTRLLEEGRISREEHDRLLKLGAAGTGSLAFNILLGFGVVAVSAGMVALVPDPVTGIIIGSIVLAGGLALYGARSTHWEIFAHICVLVGALGLGAGVVIETEGAVAALLGVAIGLAVAGIVARSGLLIVLAVLAFSSCLGARTGYMHATYFLGIEQPTLTVLVFSAVALATFLLSKRVPSAYERLALQAARTSVFLVNLGFWVGSLWGDRSDRLGVTIEAGTFGLVWAVALLAVAIWAARENRRWVVNVAAVFGAIHFYTQWFEHLGANPLSVLVAGVLALAFAVGLWHFNRALFDSARRGPVALAG